MNNVLIVGGGAAGMMAALFAAKEGASVTILERNEKLGKKIYITGKGRCNVTNDCDREAFLSQVPRNPRFLYGALALLPTNALMEMLENAGCPLTVERGRRVFPQSNKASDVTRALSLELRRLSVQVRLNARVKSLIVKEARVRGVQLESGETIAADAVILATGGKSYPITGSTGDGYQLAQEAGHTITPLQPSLAPLVASESWVGELTGLSLKNVRLSAQCQGKAVYSEQGEMLFTHFGISGPLTLEMSSHLIAYPPEQWRVTLDLKPALTPEQLEARLLRDFAEMSRKQFANLLPGLLPGKLADIFPRLLNIPGDKPVHQISREERQRLKMLLKELPLPICGIRPIDEAIVTRGGIPVKEISPATMESKLTPGLYFAGEMIDVDAHTGGFNLHIAFSTGALAGKSAARPAEN
jgi:predicted Rossmann fold flavoprotein